MTAFALFPESTPLALGELTTFSYSTFREQIPVRTLGRVSTKGYGKGNRTVAGTMVFTVYHKHIVYKIQEHAASLNIKRLKTDELPPFDMVITFGNEYGATSRITIYGISVVDEGGVFSVEDMYSENTMSYVARDIDLMYGPVGNSMESRAMPDSYGRIVDAVARFASNPEDLALPVISIGERRPNMPGGSHHGSQPNHNRTHAPAAGMGDILPTGNVSRIVVSVVQARTGTPIQGVTVDILSHQAQPGELTDNITNQKGIAMLVVDPTTTTQFLIRVRSIGLQSGLEFPEERRTITVSRGKVVATTFMIETGRLDKIITIPVTKKGLVISQNEVPGPFSVQLINSGGNPMPGIEVSFSYMVGSNIQGNLGTIRTNNAGIASMAFEMRDEHGGIIHHPFMHIIDNSIVVVIANINLPFGQRRTIYWEYGVLRARTGRMIPITDGSGTTTFISKNTTLLSFEVRCLNSVNLPIIGVDVVFSYNSARLGDFRRTTSMTNLNGIAKATFVVSYGVPPIIKVTAHTSNHQISSEHSSIEWQYEVITS